MSSRATGNQPEDDENDFPVRKTTTTCSVISTSGTDASMFRELINYIIPETLREKYNGLAREIKMVVEKSHWRSSTVHDVFF